MNVAEPQMELRRTETELDVCDEDEDKQETEVVLSHLLVLQITALKYIIGERSTVPKLNPLTVKLVTPEGASL
jgi:hypothetical protein